MVKNPSLKQVGSRIQTPTPQYIM